MSTITCTQCNKLVESSDKFCQHCGTPILQTTGPESNPTAPKSSKTITSSGNYSGTMIKGKGSRTRKTIRNIVIGIVLGGIITLIIWFQVDPEAGKKLTNVAFGFGFILVFVFFIYRAAKKGKYKKKRGAAKNDYDLDDHDNNDNDGDNDN
ncbi:MAG: zinc ribbon domain-containing protein [Draconibacterium sp.]|nr:zinc ribbon domain-containing protein [Draconibacterium sp.]